MTTYHVRLKMEMYYYLARGHPLRGWFRAVLDDTPGVIQIVTPAENKPRLWLWLEQRRLACYFFGDWLSEKDYQLVMGPIHAKTQMSS